MTGGRSCRADGKFNATLKGREAASGVGEKCALAHRLLGKGPFGGISLPGSAFLAALTPSKGRFSGIEIEKIDLSGRSCETGPEA